MSILKHFRRGFGGLRGLRLGAWLEPDPAADALKAQELGEANSARAAHSQREDRRLAALTADDKLARERVSRRAESAKSADGISGASAPGVAKSTSQPAAPKGPQAVEPVEPLVVLDIPAAGTSQSQAKSRTQ